MKSSSQEPRRRRRAEPESPPSRVNGVAHRPSRSPKPPAKKPSGLSDAEITELMYEKLGTSALTRADAKKLHLGPIPAHTMARLGFPAFAAFGIPYFDFAGSEVRFYRARYVEPTQRGFDAIAGKKALRYVQPAGTEPELYLPPLVNWEKIAADPGTPVVITEGELKSACATKHGYPTIGLGGVWSFQSTATNTPLIEDLRRFEWKERYVYICYDSDAATNPQVLVAEQRLAHRLTELGANVFITRLPSQEELTKCGLDDYIVLYGPEAFARLLAGPKTYAYAQCAALHQLSEKVVYVRNPGIIWEHAYHRRMAPSDFVNHAYSNVTYSEEYVKPDGSPGMRTKYAAPEWLKWPARAECIGMTFAPGGPRVTEDGYLNTWTSWGVADPIPGDVSHWERLLDHLFGDDRHARTYFERWCAYPLQHPGTKMAVAAAIWGHVHGSGKTLIGHTLMRIYGRHAAELKDADLENERNAWADGVCFALCDDVTARGDRKFMRLLMTMVTQKTVTINPKYVAEYTIPDRINYYFTSNDPDALYMDERDRRFFVHETRADRYADYKAYVKWRDSEEGTAALWHYLLSLPLGDFDPQAAAPLTTSKASMIEVGKSELGAWVEDFRRNTDFILSQAGLKGDLFSMKQLHLLYDPAGTKRASPNALAREFKREGFTPAARGAPIRMSDGFQSVVWPVRNFDHWNEASWSDVRTAYAAHYTPAKRSKL